MLFRNWVKKRENRRNRTRRKRSQHRPSAPSIESLEPRLLLDGNSLSLLLPNQAYEGDGVLAGAATVSVAQPLAEDLVVSLASNDTSEVTVPETVTIPAGQTSATFDLAIQDDTIVDFTQFVSINASAAGYDPANATMSVHDNDEIPGAPPLAFLETYRDGVNGVDGLLFAWGASVSPDGRHVYVTGFSDDAIAVFARDPLAGQLSFVERLKDGLNGVDGLDKAKGVSVSSDGRNVYVASRGDDAITVFARDSSTGQLSFVQTLKDGLNGVDGLDGAYGVSVTLDGRNVYVTGELDNAVVLFTRDISTGELSYTGRFIDLDFATGVFTSPDGRNVYVASRGDNAVTVFSRDASTGSFSYVERLRNGVNGVGGLDSPYDVSVSSDGRNVYIAGQGDGAIVVFARDASTGKLSFVECFKDGVNGVDGLAGARGVTVSPDGRNVYATGNSDDAIAVFARDVSTGKLNFVERLKDGINGVDGLGGACGVSISPDGRHVYVTGDNTVTLFSRNGSTGLLSLTVPRNVSEGDGILASQGIVTISSPIEEDLIVSLVSNDTSEITVPDTLTIPAGQISATFDITVVNDADLDPAQRVAITAFAEGYLSKAVEIRIQDDEMAELTVELPTSATEGDGVLAGQGTVTVNQAPAVDVTVQFSSNDTSELRVPATVTIPAGQTSATFDVTIVNESVIDGPQTATVTAHVDGWTDGSASMQVLDNEIPEITVTLPSQATEGDGLLAGQGAVAISLRREEDLIVTLTSADPTEITVPASVTIPAGQTSATFDVTVIDDTDLDFFQTALITASADGHVSDSASVQVQDNEFGIFTVAILSSAIEGDGVLAGQGKVTVNRAPTVDVVVQLSSDDTSELTVPRTVSIPAGQTSATFDLTIIDDSIIDGKQTANVTAHVDGWTDGSDSTQVQDNEIPEITVTLPAQATEGDGLLAGQGTIAISLPREEDLIVTLTSADPTEITVPETVTIPAGQISVTFDVTIVDDTEMDLTQTAVISASAMGHDSADATMSVRDDDTYPGAPPLTFLEMYKSGQNGVSGLWGAMYMSVSPDGRNVYATSWNEFVVAVFTRDTATGQLNFVQTLRDGVNGVDGLYGIQDLSVSPDGRHVYVTGNSDDAIAIFTRDASTGQLSFVERLKDGVNEVDGLDGACDVSVSPDGRHVYVTGSSDDAVVVFTRDASTGQLRFVERLKDGVNGVDGLDGACDVSVSPDGQHVYITGNIDDAIAVFTRDASTGQLRFVERLKDGVNEVDGLDGACDVSVSPDGRHVYITGNNDDAIAVFARDVSTGQLNFVQILKDGVNKVEGLFDVTAESISPDGKYVYATSRSHDSIAVFQRNASTGQLTFVQILKDDINGVDGLAYARDVAVSPDGRHVYTTSFEDNAISLFARNGSTILLSLTVPQGAMEDGGILAGQGTVTVSLPATKDLVVSLVSNDTSELIVPVTVTIPAGQTSATFDITVVDDTDLDFFQTATITASANGHTTDSASVQIQDNEFGILTVTLPTSASENSGVLAGQGTVTVNQAPTVDVIVQLSSNDTSELTVPATITIPAGQTSATFDVTVVDDSVIDGPQAVIVTAHVNSWTDGTATTQVLDNEVPEISLTLPAEVTEGDGILAGQGTVTVSLPVADDLVVSLASNDTSELIVPATVTIPAGQTSATFDLTVQDDVGVDFTHLVEIQAFAAGHKSANSAILVRDNDTNPNAPPLAFIEMYKDGVNGIDGLDGPNNVIVSPDGRHVYATSYGDDSLVVFARDPSTGRLSVVEILKPKIDGTFVLSQPMDVSVSPDGQYVYVTSQDYDNLTVFARDSSTGKLSFVQILKDGVGGIDSLDGANSISVSSDSRYVYVASFYDDAINVFESNPLTGRLSFIEALKDGQNRVNGLDGVKSVIVSPNGQYVYAASSGEDALAVFARDPVTGRLNFIHMLRDGSSGVDGLDGASDVTVSPDGQYVYVTGRDDRAIAVFARDSSTGRLNFVEMFKDGIGEIDGLNGANGVLVSPDGRYVYVTGGSDYAIAVFARQVSTGRLSFFGRIKDGVDGVDGLADVNDISISPDGRHIYTTASLDDALDLFSFVGSEISLSLAVPQNAAESDGVLAGQGVVAINQAPVVDLVVHLVSNDTTEATVPETVIIPAGQTSATFDITVLQDNVWDGVQTVTITAFANDCLGGMALINVVDNAAPVITVTLPANATENDGVLENRGKVAIANALSQDLLIALQSSNTDLLTVPQTVTIPAGQLSVNFNVTLRNDKAENGDTGVTVTATDFTGLVSAQAEVWIYDTPPLVLLYPSVYSVGNYWNYDLQVTWINNTSCDIRSTITDKVVRNVQFEGLDAFEVERISGLTKGVVYTDTMYMDADYVRLLRSRSQNGNTIQEDLLYYNPLELYGLAIPENVMSTMGGGWGDGGDSFDGRVTRGYQYHGKFLVTVPAGTFDCYVFTIFEEIDPQVGSSTYTEETISFNPFIGIVRDDVNWRKGFDNYFASQTLRKTNLRVPGDLTVTVAQPQNAGNLISGNTVRVPIRVTNTGQNTISGKMDIQVFIQENQAIQPGDAPTAVLQNQKVALRPGQTAIYYANVQLPLGVAGDFHCVAKIDSANTILELNEANNIAATLDTMNVQLGFVDLTGRLNRVALPTAVVAGQRLRGSVAVNVVNQGNVPLGPKVLVNVALFARNTDTGELVALGRLQGRNVSKLAPNGSSVYSFVVPVNLPNGLPKGDYELCAQITPTAPLPESNLANNLITQQNGGLGAVAVKSDDPFIDLVAGVDNRLAARYPLPNRIARGSGARLYVPVTITNLGNVLTDRRQYIDVAIYAQDANGVRVLVATLQRQNIGNLAPGRTKTLLARTTLPAGLAAGQYTLVAETDSGNALVESDETNNTVALAGTMNVY